MKISYVLSIVHRLHRRILCRVRDALCSLQPDSRKVGVMPFDEAMRVIREHAFARFDETVNLAVKYARTRYACSHTNGRGGAFACCAVAEHMPSRLVRSLPFVFVQAQLRHEEGQHRSARLSRLASRRRQEDPDRRFCAWRQGRGGEARWSDDRRRRRVRFSRTPHPVPCSLIRRAAHCGNRALEAVPCVAWCDRSNCGKARLA